MTEPLAAQMRTVAKARRKYAKQMTAAAGDERLPLEHNTSWVMADALDAFADAADRAAAEASAREAAYVAALERIQNRAQRIMAGQVDCTAYAASDYSAEVARAALSAAPERARALAGLVQRAVAWREAESRLSGEVTAADFLRLEGEAQAIVKDLAALGMEGGHGD
jgi:hypothetical protein